MYIRASHRPLHPDDVTDILRNAMFATLVTPSPDGLIATHLPFVYEVSGGEHGTLFAHMARANTHGSLLGNGEESLVVFLGPHAYISPSWYSDRATAPTWDYAAVHCYGNAVLHTGEDAERNVARLIATMEGDREDGWSMSELPRTEIDELLANIVSFQIPITRIEAKFKVSRGETRERNLAAVERLEASGDGAIAAYIRRYNDL